jgi:hypothetical protein
VLVALVDHLPTGVEQDGREQVQHPAEAGDQHRPGGDEGAAEDQSAEHSEEQHPVLVLTWYGEVAEDDGPHEDVVDREGLLDQVAGEVLLAQLVAVPPPDQYTEADTTSHPHDRPDGGLPDTDHMGMTVRDQVDQQHGDHRSDDGEPQPERDIHETASSPSTGGLVGRITALVTERRTPTPY